MVNNHTDFKTKKVGKGYRKFDGDQYQFQYAATMRGSFANDGYKKHLQEVKDKVSMLRKQGYKVRTSINTKGETLIYTHGSRKR